MRKNGKNRKKWGKSKRNIHSTQGNRIKRKYDFASHRSAEEPAESVWKSKKLDCSLLPNEVRASDTPNKILGGSETSPDLSTGEEIRFRSRLRFFRSAKLFEPFVVC